MSNPSKRKGDRAELEAAVLLQGLTGWPVRRALGAGRADDCGDLDGLPNCVVQVKHHANIAASIREGLDGAERQRHNAGTTYGVALIRRPKVRGRHNGDQWVVCMSPDVFARLLGAATEGGSPVDRGVSD